jgi:hypothetical protein
MHRIARPKIMDNLYYAVISHFAHRCRINDHVIVLLEDDVRSPITEALHRFRKQPEEVPTNVFGSEVRLNREILDRARREIGVPGVGAQTMYLLVVACA